ncbi:MAG: diphosphomevalonate decarboxylase [Pseudomonadota bacterium]
MTDPSEIFARKIPAPLKDPQQAKAYAPSNIALSKYWGKRDVALNLPLNSSLSISLGEWGTDTEVSPAETDSLTFNGDVLSDDAPFARKLWGFVDLFCGAGRPALKITTTNSIPTAAGLASSASGFAALTKALDRAFNLNLPVETLSMLSRFGSGSATRSHWHGFARWDKGSAADGSDSHGRTLDIDYPDFRIAIIPVDTGPKLQPSTDGMLHTVATSPLFGQWPTQAEADCAAIEAALRAQNFDEVGALAEANALAMHATMMAARPSLTYLKRGSWHVLETLWAARADGLRAYATMDAGANVKLLFLEGDAADVQTVFPEAQLINPFVNP